MKTKYGMLLVGALMTGCLPQTLFPLYSEETLVFEPLLLGIWEEGDEEQWTFSAADPQSFHLQIRDDEGLTGEFDVHMVDLEGTLFLDLYAEEPPDDWSDVYELHFVPVHTFIRIDITHEALTMAVMNLDWLRDHLEENPSALEHKMLGKDQVLVTAQTPELQAFVLEHLDTEGAFEEPEVLERGGS